MQNIKELRSELVENFNKAVKNEISIKKSVSVATAGDKVLKSVLVELAYNAQVGKVKQIEFMEY